jgi:hypothetical protein
MWTILFTLARAGCEEHKYCSSKFYITAEDAQQANEIMSLGPRASIKREPKEVARSRGELLDELIIPRSVVRISVVICLMI